MNRFEVANASLATETPDPALEARGFEHARAFQNRVIEWIRNGGEPVASVRAPTGGGKTATFHELVRSRGMTLIVYPTNALLRQQRERFEVADFDATVLNAATLSGHGPERVENLISTVNTYATDHDVVLTNPDILQAAIQGMYRGVDPMRLFSNVDAIVYDEFHFYDALAASGLLLQVKIIAERRPDPKILLASATPNEDFVDFLDQRVGLSVREIAAEYVDDGDRFRRSVEVVRHEDRTILDRFDEVATDLQQKVEADEGYEQPHAAVVFNSAYDSNQFHQLLSDEYPELSQHVLKDNGFDTNDESVDPDFERFYVLNTTSKGEVGLDYDLTTLHMEKPREASAFLQRFGRAGRQSPATVHVYGLGQGPWGDDVGFPTFATQIYEGLDSSEMDEGWLADLVGFRGAYAMAVRENSDHWFNQELREDFQTNVDQYGRWRRFIADVDAEIDEIRDGFGPGKYQEDEAAAKLLRFTKRCFEAFRGLRGRSLPASIRYPRGDRRALTTYDLTTTLRHYDIDDVEQTPEGPVFVLAPTEGGLQSTVTARLPEYESEPTQYDKPTTEIEDLLQTKIRRRIDRTTLDDDFEVSPKLLHRFFRIVRITDAVVPNRITTPEYDVHVDLDTAGPPTVRAQPRQR